MNKINNDLKDKILLEYYGKILEDHKLFKLTFTKKFRKKLALKMKEKIYGPGETIFK